MRSHLKNNQTKKTSVRRYKGELLTTHHSDRITPNIQHSSQNLTHRAGTRMGTHNPVFRQRLREKDTQVEASKGRPYLKNKTSLVCHLVGRVPPNTPKALGSVPQHLLHLGWWYTGKTAILAAPGAQKFKVFPGLSQHLFQLGYGRSFLKPTPQQKGCIAALSSGASGMARRVPSSCASLMT